MKRSHSFFIIIAVLLLLSCDSVFAGEESFVFGPLGRVFLYRGQMQPAKVVLLISGDEGWSKGVADRAREISGLGSIVVGVDSSRYLKNLASSAGVCSYPAADFEALSKYVQKKLHYPHYTLPVLVGYSSGAALVYAVLAQSPPNTFQGGISLGFCPELKLQKPLCRGQGLESKPGMPGKSVLFLPDDRLSTPWIVLQGTTDEVCSADEARSFVRRVPEADIVILPKVGHGFSVERDWMPEFKKALERLKNNEQASDTRNTLNDLPLVEVPASGKDSDFLAVIISGDGGWAGLDREVGGALARRGIRVVGLNALQYFWTKRTPEGASKDLARILRHYLHAWNKNNIILVGYSLGADVVPFMANRLPADLLARVREVVLLGPGRTAEFEFHLSEWLPNTQDSAAMPILPEIKKLRKKKVLCLFGAGEKSSLCSELEPDLAESVRMPGGHHFGGKYESIAGMILERIAGKE